jgi:hypothetical protein
LSYIESIIVQEEPHPSETDSGGCRGAGYFTPDYLI